MISEYPNRLYNIREKLNLKQDDIANNINVSRRNYSFWETGHLFIPLKHLNNYCNTFNVSMDYVLCLSDENIQLKKIKKLNKVEIGEKLKMVLKDNNVTQNEMAELLNTTQSTLSAYINGKTLIITSFAYQICKEYNISLDWLCGRE